MLLKNNIEKIKEMVNSDNALSSLEERYCYAQDATNNKLSGDIPDIVVFVETIEEVQNIVKYANTHKIPIISRGAGTNMVGACTCKSGGIVLNFSKMNKILDINTSNMTARVQPGVVLGDLKECVEEQGLYYPPDPSNFKVSTIGGSIAQASGGPKSFKYGTTKDYILSLTVVTANGEIMKLGSGTIKDAVGYHLNQLIVGSEGTLAIIVEAELKLIPKPETNAVIMAYFAHFNEATKAVNEVILSGIFPSTLEFMDNNAIRTVEDFYPCGLDTTMDAMLIIETDGYSSSIDQQLNLAIDALNRAHATGIKIAKNRTEIEKIWTARRASYAATAKLAPDVLSDDIIVPREHLPQMVMSIKEICSKHNLKVSIVGHAGDGNIHPQIALNVNDDEEYKSYLCAKSEIYKKAIDLNGTISAEHGIGIDKIDFMNKFLDNNSLEYMKRIKLLFDPNNILNPGKVVKIN